MKNYLSSFIFFVLISIHCLPLNAAENGKFRSLTDLGPYETPSRYASGTVTFNLGATGARGWYRAHNGGKLFWGENGWEILITTIYPGSPADGKLQVFDVVVGADGKTFDGDALKCLGKAIAKTQRGNGKLELMVWRQGKFIDVTLELPQLPGDSIDAPIAAEDSEAIRKQYLDFLEKNMHPDGFKQNAVYASLNALYLLANGKPEHLDYIRRYIRRIVENKDESKYGPWNWQKGTNTTLLAEYFLKTGDTSVLPAIKQNMEWMRNSQSYAGGWGHGGPYGGYGHVGLPALFTSVGAVLGRECGVSGYDKMIDDSRKFHARGAGLGKVGYGGFTGDTNLKTLYGDNGKSGSAALFYSVLGDEKVSKTFANTACALAAYSESGHSGHFWSFSWGSLGANLGDLANRKYFAKELDWYYALARTYRGGLTVQPWYASMGSYAPGGEELATGGMALWYCTPLRSLRILGGEKSVLSQDLPEDLEQARKLIFEKNYSKSLVAIEEFKPSDEKERKQAEALKEIAGRQVISIKLTIESIYENIEKGNLYTAERQFHSLKPTFSQIRKVKDEELGILPQEEEIEKILNSDKSKAIIEAGQKYYNAMHFRPSPDKEFFYRAPAIVFNPKERKAIKEIAESKESGVYSEMAKTALKRWKPYIPPKYQTLLEKEVSSAGTYEMFMGKGENAKNGVSYKYYEFDTIPNSPKAIRDMKPVKKGKLQGFSLNPKKRKTNFAFIFRTFVEIKNDAEYTFTITSDDGSYLYVNGKELINNGGLHGMIPKSGTIRLKPGRHEVECIMFQAAHGFGLRVEMASKEKSTTPQIQEIPFQVKDHRKLKKLKLSVNASDPVAVYLNGEVICRFHKKRRKNMFDGSWREWEKVTLRPEALKLLKQGKNVLGVSAGTSKLDPKSTPVGVKLQGQ